MRGKQFLPFLATLTMHASVNNNVNSSWSTHIHHTVKYHLARIMTPHLSPTKKAHVRQWNLEGKSNNWIAEQFGKDQQTIDCLVHHLCQNTSPYAVTTRRGHLRATSKHDLQGANLEMKRGHTSVPDYSLSLLPTARNALDAARMSGRVHRKSPFSAGVTS